MATMRDECARAGLGWRREDPGQWRGVNPIPFHASNILLHALVTCLVFKCGGTLLDYA